MKLAPLFTIGALAAISLLGCSNEASNGTNASSATSQETTTLRFSHFWPATSSIST